MQVQPETGRFLQVPGAPHHNGGTLRLRSGSSSDSPGFARRVGQRPLARAKHSALE